LEEAQKAHPPTTRGMAINALVICAASFYTFCTLRFFSRQSVCEASRKSTIRGAGCGNNRFNGLRRGLLIGLRRGVVVQNVRVADSSSITLTFEPFFKTSLVGCWRVRLSL